MLRYLKGVPRVMAVRGETLDEDVLKMAPRRSVHGQADADWGGDADRNSTNGVIAWVKAATDRWYLVQSVGRKHTTVALSTAEAELISMLQVCARCAAEARCGAGC